MVEAVAMLTHEQFEGLFLQVDPAFPRQAFGILIPISARLRARHHCLQQGACQPVSMTHFAPDSLVIRGGNPDC